MKTRTKERREESYLSPGVLRPFVPDCHGDLSGPARFVPGAAASASVEPLVYRPVMTLSAATILSAYREVSAATMDEWRHDGKGEPVLLSSPKSLKAPLSYSAARVGER